MGDIMKKYERDSKNKVKKEIDSSEVSESSEKSSKTTALSSTSKSEPMEVKKEALINKVRKNSSLPIGKIDISKHTTKSGEVYFYDQKSRIVFNNISRKAYASLDDKFNLQPLTKEQIEFLEKRNINYDETYFNEPEEEVLSEEASDEEYTEVEVTDSESDE